MQYALGGGGKKKKDEGGAAGLLNMAGSLLGNNNKPPHGSSNNSSGGMGGMVAGIAGSLLGGGRKDDKHSSSSNQNYHGQSSSGGNNDGGLMGKVSGFLSGGGQVRIPLPTSSSLSILKSLTDTTPSMAATAATHNSATPTTSNSPLEATPASHRQVHTLKPNPLSLILRRQIIMSRSRDNRSLLRRDIIHRSLTTNCNMEAVTTASKEDRVAMDSREAVMADHRNMVDHRAATVVDSTKEEVMVGSTEVLHQGRVVMEDTREVIKVHQVATHHKEVTKEDIQDTRVVILDTRACLRLKN